jgi:hypothetical protein
MNIVLKPPQNVGPPLLAGLQDGLKIRPKILHVIASRARGPVPKNLLWIVDLHSIGSCCFDRPWLEDHQAVQILVYSSYA